MFSGASAGLIAQAATYPFEVIRRHSQLNGSSSQYNYVNTPDIFLKIYQRWGLGGFYKGFSVTCIKSVPSSAILFFMSE